MLLEIRAAAPFFTNGFVLACDRTAEAVVIDPGDNVDELLEIVDRRKLSVGHILLTHAHIDHVSGAARARTTLGAPIYLHRADLFLYQGAVEHGRLFGVEIEPPPPVDRFYDLAAPPIRFGDHEVRVHHTPGHCPGGVCLQVGAAGKPGKQLIVGDTLFAGSIGRTDLPGGDYTTLIRSITEVLFAFGDDAEVYPGHGPMTTIGRERESNPFLTTR